MNVHTTLEDMQPTPAAGQQVVVPPHIGIGDRIRMGVTTYELVAKASGRKRFVNVDQPETEVWLDNVELVSLMARREVTIASPIWLNEARSKVWELPFEARSETDKRLARWRHDYVQAFLDNRRQGYPQTPEAVRDMIHTRRIRSSANIRADEKAPGLSAVYEWLKIWEQPGVRTLKRLCFAESSRGGRGVNLDPDVVPIVRDALRELWYTQQRHRVRTV